MTAAPLAASRAVTTRRWFDRPALAVAPQLLGMRLVHNTTEGPISGRIVEVEAYRGPEDLAAHSAHGRTARNAAMWGEPGHLYVYLVYGLHRCLNIVCGPGAKPEAVLIRACEIERGAELARQRRGDVPFERLAAGPGNVGAAFGIGRELDGSDLLGGPVHIEAGEAPAVIATRPRVGVAYAGDWALRPYRFLLPDDPHVSRR